MPPRVPSSLLALVECSALTMTSMSLGVTKAPPALGDGVRGDVNLSSGIVCHEKNNKTECVRNSRNPPPKGIHIKLVKISKGSYSKFSENDQKVYYKL